MMDDRSGDVFGQPNTNEDQTVKTYKIAAIPADGIGPEVMGEVRRVLDWFKKKHRMPMDIAEDLIGGEGAIGALGDWMIGNQHIRVIIQDQGWSRGFGIFGGGIIDLQTVGVPGFQFIQDPLDYSSRLHHTSLDSYDHLKPEDLRQAAVVLASVLLSAANSDEPLPRMPLPTRPTPSDPFAVSN